MAYTYWQDELELLAPGTRRGYLLYFKGFIKWLEVDAEARAHIVEGIDSTSDESKKVIDKSLGVENVFTKQGIIGVLTGGVIDRRGLLADATVCALTPFLNPSYYSDT